MSGVVSLVTLTKMRSVRTTVERTYFRPYLSAESLNFAQASARISCRYVAGVILITVRRAVVSKTVTVELMSGRFRRGELRRRGGMGNGAVEEARRQQSRQFEVGDQVEFDTMSV